MNITVLAGIAVISAVLCVIVRQYRPEYALGISIACGVIILIAAVSLLSPSIQAINDLAEASGIDGSFARVLLKALAICYITRLAADCCRDAGESAAASKLELAGRAAITAVSLPVFTELAEIVRELLSL